MKFSRAFANSGWVLIVTLASVAFKNIQQSNEAIRNEKAAPQKGFAVVELFTSEGCSSCPPADKLVARVEQEYQGKAVYILAYHVDYWDQLGWKDRFSAATFSNRQRQYANWLHLNSIYTPQIVVNGLTEFVGSNERALEKAIVKGLTDSSLNRLSLRAQVDNSRLKVDYETDVADKGAILVLALIQKSGQSAVRAGENEGLTLMHVQIVRKLISEAIKSKNGNIALDLQKDSEPKKLELIGFIQDKKDGRIICADKIELANVAP